MAVGDFDGNGLLDLAVIVPGSTFVSVLLGSPEGRFTQTAVIDIGQPATAVAAGDIDGDGKLDLAVTSLGRVVLLRGNGQGEFEHWPTLEGDGAGEFTPPRPKGRRRSAIDVAIAGISRPRAAANHLPNGSNDRFSRRELDVIRLSSQGYTAKQVAGSLGIGERTVETHVSNAYAKLGVNTKLELVLRMIELGIPQRVGAE